MCTYVRDTNGRLVRGHHVFIHDFVSVHRIVFSSSSDWPASAVDVVKRPQDLVQLERARLEIYMISLAPVMLKDAKNVQKRRDHALQA